MTPLYINLQSVRALSLPGDWSLWRYLSLTDYSAAKKKRPPQNIYSTPLSDPNLSVANLFTIFISSSSFAWNSLCFLLLHSVNDRKQENYGEIEGLPIQRQMFASGFSVFGSGASDRVDNSTNSNAAPVLKLQTDKDVYRPGDPVVVTAEICNVVPHMECSILIERLSFEIKGLQKFDTQWFATQKQVPGSKQRRGEHFFMVGSVPIMVSNQIISAGTTKSYMVRTAMPSVIPPSYKGSTIRYLYYVRIILSGRWLKLENGHPHKESVKDNLEMEARVPLQVWVSQKSSNFVENQNKAIQMDILWKEMDGDSDWVRANDMYNGAEEEYESSRDEVSSVSSYNPMRESLSRNFGSSLSLQSYAPRSSMKDNQYLEGGRASFSSNVTRPWMTVAEVSYDTGVLSPQQQKLVKRISAEGDTGTSSSRGAGAPESTTSEGFLRGRSYNIRLDDQVLLRFSPKNSDSTYYFSDMIGGTLTFFHEEGARRCLEVSITLETSETINRQFVHPSRRNSPTITKVQSDYHEVVADLIQTSFLFSIPMDGPMSFSTQHVTVQWSLRFEFFTTPKNIDWTRYEHPLLIEGREKSEWVLPIVVHAPSSAATPATYPKDERPFTSEPLWVHN